MNSENELRIAGTVFSARYQVSEGDCETSAPVADPEQYKWVLRGRSSFEIGEDGDPAFELSTDNGRITIETGNDGDSGPVKEVVCAFRASDTEGLKGTYRAQLTATKDGIRVLGTEVEAFRFTPAF